MTFVLVSVFFFCLFFFLDSRLETSEEEKKQEVGGAGHFTNDLFAAAGSSFIKLFSIYKIPTVVSHVLYIF